MSGKTRNPCITSNDVDYIQPVRRSQRTSKPKCETDYDYDTYCTRSYDLSKQKALQQKQIACKRQIFTNQIKSGGQLRLKLSTSAYEVFRSSVADFYSDANKPRPSEFRDIAAIHASVFDKKHTAIVEDQYKVYNRLKN